MTMWAENTQGMHNLFGCPRAPSLEGFFYKPRMDKEILAEHASGLMVTTGCPSGGIRPDSVSASTTRRCARPVSCRTSLGATTCSRADGSRIDIEKRVRDDLLRLGVSWASPVATNDSPPQQPRRRRRPRRPDLRGVGQSACGPQTRLKFDGGGCIKSAAEMRELWADRFGMPEACDNTLLIAERCEVEFTESTGGYMARRRPGQRDRGMLVPHGGLARYRGPLPDGS